MNLTKKIIKQLGPNRLINYKDRNQFKGRFEEIQFSDCEYLDPEPAIYYGLWKILKFAHHLTITGGMEIDQEPPHNKVFINRTYFEVQAELNIIHKPKLRENLKYYKPFI